ncbi:hypothetical protein O6H91_16G032600 [Diphasiastrum complanatum]|uniref:Uncharacterized protein n=2 Tax=Diphasiastrum complanatum TaxID=34168 RepID=A0ACC2BC64_DIPCM|nr:hypothetical protein O6H91_16G024600 [Diphasiastrum complanatum]KAJ7527019.1 hypothetical protein O6H91_16G032600 [Diphasiastrum complanatum]
MVVVVRSFEVATMSGAVVGRTILSDQCFKAYMLQASNAGEFFNCQGFCSKPHKEFVPSRRESARVTCLGNLNAGHPIDVLDNFGAWLSVSPQLLGAQLATSPLLQKRQTFKQPFKAVATTLTENWLASEELTSLAAAEEAMALARSAVMAAREVAYLATSPTDTDTSTDFSSETESLKVEQISGLDETGRFGVSHSLRGFQKYSETGLIYEDSLTGAAAMGTQSTLQFLGTVVEPAIWDTALYKDESGLDDEQLFSHKELIDLMSSNSNEVIAVSSKRHSERATRRVKAKENKKAAVIEPVRPKPKRAKKRKLAAESPNMISAFLRKAGKSRLLTAAEEVEMAKGTQELMKMEEIKARLQKTMAREPTSREWAEALGMDHHDFEKKLQKGRLCKSMLFRSNLRLVVSIAKRYQRRGASLQDLIQDGTTGLLRGVEKYDAKKGFRFSTYASWWIKQAVTKSLAKYSVPVRLPMYLYEVFSRINKAKSELLEKDGHQPSVEKIAEFAGLSTTKVISVTRLFKQARSLDKRIGDEDSSTLGDFLADNHTRSSIDVAEQELMRKCLDQILNTLSPRERDVMVMRYGLANAMPKTLKDIGVACNLSRERIRQLERQAMRKLRQPGVNCVMRTYLGDIDLFAAE